MLIEKEVFFLNYIKSNWKIVLFPLYALFIFLAFTFMRSYTVTDADRLFLTPTFEDSNGWDIYKMENGTKKEASVQELFDSSGETFYPVYWIKAWNRPGIPYWNWMAQLGRRVSFWMESFSIL